MKKSKANLHIKIEHHQRANRSARLAEELRANLKRRKEREHPSFNDSSEFTFPLLKKQKEN